MQRPIFTSTRWREGYSRNEVDAVVEQVLAGGLTADEVRDVVFPPVHNRPGYDMAEVDNWLDGAVIARGGRPAEGPTPSAPTTYAGLDPAELAYADRLRAAFIIAVTVAVTIWLYVSRF